MNALDILPHDDGSERAILAAWLSGEGRVGRLPDESLLYNPAHKEVLRALDHLSSSGQSTDIASVDQWLAANVKNRLATPALLGEISASSFIANPQNYSTLIGGLSKFSARRKAREMAERLGHAASNGNFDEFIGDAAAELKKIQRLNSASMGGGKFPDLVGAHQLASRKVQMPREIIAGILRQGQKMIVQSGSKANKSNLAIYRALAVSMGMKWLGRDTEQGMVIFVNMELPDWAMDYRIQQISLSTGIEATDHLQILNLRGFEFQKPREILDHVVERMERIGEKPVLIEIDPIYKFYKGRNENDAAEMGEVLAEIDAFQVETGAAVAFSHHYSKGNKSGADIHDRSAGSGVFARDVDALLDILPHEEEGCFIMSTSLRTERNIKPFVFQWEFPHCTLRTDLDPDRPKQKGGRKPQANLDEFCQLIQSEERLRSSELIKRAEDILGVGRSTAYSLVKKAKRAGLIGLDQVTHKLYRAEPVDAPKDESQPF